MERRFYHKQPPTRPEKRKNLQKEGTLIRKLMKHVEGKGKINRFRQPDPRRRALVKDYPGGKCGSLDLGPHPGKHSLLQITGVNPA